MRNATCTGTQTSKAPTRVAILFISYSVLISTERPVNIACFIWFINLLNSLLRVHTLDLRVTTQAESVIIKEGLPKSTSQPQGKHSTTVCTLRARMMENG